MSSSPLSDNVDYNPGMVLATIVESHVVRREDKHESDVTLVMMAADHVSATMLALASMKKTGELKRPDRVVFVDGGSSLNHNWEQFCAAAEWHGNGLVVRTEKKLWPDRNWMMLIGGRIIKTTYGLFLDNDIDMKQAGMLDAMLSHMQNKNVCAVGPIIPKRPITVRVRGYEGYAVPQMGTYCTLWRMAQLTNNAMADGMHSRIRDKKYYDVGGRVLERCLAAGFSVVEFNEKSYMDHWGCISWGRRIRAEGRRFAGQDIFDATGLRYEEIKKRLAEHGIEAIDDPWTPDSFRDEPLLRIQLRDV